MLSPDSPSQTFPTGREDTPVQDCENEDLDEVEYISPKEVGSPVNLFSKKMQGDRPDVVHKTILRSFKKHYSNDFNRVTDYKRKKRRVSKKHQILDLAGEYMQKRFPDCQFQSSEMRYYVASLVQPKCSEELQNNQNVQKLNSLVNDVLYYFNKSKMNALLEHQQYAYLLLKFLELPSSTEIILSRSSSQKHKNLEVYYAQIKDLKGRCFRVSS